MATLSRIRLAFLLVSSVITGFAFALGVNGGAAVTMGSLRGASLGTASGISYSTGARGLTAVYGQNVMSIGGKPYVIPAAANTSRAGVIAGLRKLIKSPWGKANIGLIVGVWALDGILEETGFYSQNNDYIKVNLDEVVLPPDSFWITTNGEKYSSFSDYLSKILSQYKGSEIYEIKKSNFFPNALQVTLVRNGNGVFSGIIRLNGACPDGSYFSERGCVAQTKQTLVDAVDTLDFGTWEPPQNVPKEHVQRLYPHILPSHTEITTKPQVIDYPAEILVAPDGTVTEKTRRETVTVTDPNTDPAFHNQEQTTVKTYKDGQLIDTQTTTRTTDSTAATPNQITQPQEQLTDCAFFPTLCKWLDWTQQPPPSDADLPALIPVTDLQDVEQKKDVRFGTAVCPTPSKIYIATIGKTVEFDWAFICQIAEKIKYFILAAAYLMAIRINLGVLRG